MSSDLENLLNLVKSRVTPTPQDRRRLENLAKKLMARLEAQLASMGLEAEVRLEGSIAKDTWLRGDADIDIFMLIPEDVPRDRLSKDYLEAARRVVEEFKVVERFAEHPYVEAWVNPRLRVNLVPCYKVTPPNWKSATDRTPYHTEYVKARLGGKGRSEVRILKRFMKGVGVYGSDIKTGGFSGYLTELLILAYGSFVEVLKEASRWRPGVIIDLEGYYGGREREARILFENHCLIVVDPVDKSRNAASPVREEVFHWFKASASHFLEKPSLKFFYPPKPRPPTPSRLKQVLKKRGTDILFLRLKGVNAVPDILWGQLYKTEKALVRLMKAEGFNVLRSASWSDEEENSVMLFELEQAFTGEVVKHYGPPVGSKEEGRFLAKHLNSPRTVAGPYIEGGRWTVLLHRKYADVRALLREKLKDGGRNVGVASRIAASIKSRGFNLWLNGEILSFYRENRGFKAFLAQFLKGKPVWLEG